MLVLFKFSFSTGAILFAVLTVSITVSIPLPALLPVIVKKLSGLYNLSACDGGFPTRRLFSNRKKPSGPRGVIALFWFEDACGLWPVSDFCAEDEEDEGE